MSAVIEVDFDVTHLHRGRDYVVRSSEPILVLRESSRQPQALPLRSRVEGVDVSELVVRRADERSEIVERLRRVAGDLAESIDFLSESTTFDASRAVVVVDGGVAAPGYARVNEEGVLSTSTHPTSSLVLRTDGYPGASGQGTTRVSVTTSSSGATSEALVVQTVDGSRRRVVPIIGAVPRRTDFIPQFIAEDYPRLGEFVLLLADSEAAPNGSLDWSANGVTLSDLDEAPDEVVAQVAADSGVTWVPQGRRRFVLKHLPALLRARGSERARRFVLRAAYGVESRTGRPSDRTTSTSSSAWVRHRIAYVATTAASASEWGVDPTGLVEGRPRGAASDGSVFAGWVHHALDVGGGTWRVALTSTTSPSPGSLLSFSGGAVGRVVPVVSGLRLLQGGTSFSQPTHSTLRRGRLRPSVVGGRVVGADVEEPLVVIGTPPASIMCGDCVLAVEVGGSVFAAKGYADDKSFSTGSTVIRDGWYYDEDSIEVVSGVPGATYESVLEAVSHPGGFLMVHDLVASSTLSNAPGPLRRRVTTSDGVVHESPLLATSRRRSFEAAPWRDGATYSAGDVVVTSSLDAFRALDDGPSQSVPVHLDSATYDDGLSWEWLGRVPHGDADLALIGCYLCSTASTVVSPPTQTDVVVATVEPHEFVGKEVLSVVVASEAGSTLGGVEFEAPVAMTGRQRIRVVLR